MSAIPALWSSPSRSHPGTVSSLPNAGVEPPQNVHFAAPAHATTSNARGTELMRRFQQSGDGLTFYEIYQNNEARIRKIVESCLRFGARDICAEEIVQNVFVSIFRSAARFRPGLDDAFKNWSAQIARNAVRRALREHKHWSRFSGVLHEHHAAPPVDPCSPGLFAECGLAYRLILAAIAHAQAGLLPRDREVLHAAEVELLDYREIARRFSMRPATVRMVIFRARRRLYDRVEALLYL